MTVNDGGKKRRQEDRPARLHGLFRHDRILELALAVTCWWWK